MKSIYNSRNTSVIICCAGMGTRLGIGTTKALVDICGKPLIIRQLELLKEYDDIRIVVGYDAKKLVQTVTKYRRDLMIVFNYDYEKTGPGDSLRKALIGARDIVITLDGDTLQNKEDFYGFLKYDGECIAVAENASNEGVLAEIINGEVVYLKKEHGNIQWSGIAKVKKERLCGNDSYVYEMLNRYMPLKAFMMRIREINTQEDYENAIEWYCAEQVNFKEIDNDENSYIWSI